MSNITEAARIFAVKRRDRAGFAEYPGTLPDTLEQAYATQAAAIAEWDRPIIGWKVGRIMGDDAERHGENRFIGPIFADDMWQAPSDGMADLPVIEGGFAALEAELVARVAAPDSGPTRSAGDCAALVTGWHIGIEVAGSPLSSINDLGPLASIAGFGNNIGLILGPQVQLDDPGQIRCAVTIDDDRFGPATAAALPGGPLEAVAFALNKLKALGYDEDGEWLISTGAITGVHKVEAGQNCTASFEPGGDIACRTVTLSR